MRYRFLFDEQKGQLYSTDALLSIVVFLFGVVLVTGLTNQFDIQSSSLISSESRQSTTQHLFGTIFSTQGVPSYWEFVSDRNDVQQIGLINHGYEIDEEKWNAFVDWNNDDYPSLASYLGIPNQKFYITILDSNRTNLGSAGITPVDANSVTTVTIPLVYKQKPVMVTVQVHQ